MAQHLALEMRQYANPVEEVLSALEQVCSSHKRVKRLKREGQELRFDFKIPLIVPGGMSWILRVEPFLDGATVTAFVVKGLGYQGTSAAADRLDIKPLLAAATRGLVGHLPPGPEPLAALVPADTRAEWTQHVLVALDRAEHHSERGDVVREELSIWLAEDTETPMGKSAGEWISAEISARVDAGRLRRRVEVIGEIGEDLTLMSDRIVCSRKIKALPELLLSMTERTVRPLDARVKAMVTNSSATSSLAKPSLVKRAMRNVLPEAGSFVLTHPQWELIIPADPAALDRASNLADRVNAMFGGAPHDAGAQPQVPAASPAGAVSVPDQLRDFAALHRDGVLTDEEFASAKAKLLGG